MAGADVTDLGTTPHLRKPSSLTLMNMLALNAVVCGLEFCASAAFCYVPPLLLKSGIAEQNMTMILAVGPLLGFFIVPIIGRSSDRCKSRYGRRRPYILGLSVTLLTALLVLAYGDSLGAAAFGRGPLGHSAGIAILVVGCVLLDFSCQACLTPCEALLSDTSKESGQHDRCFTIYSLAVSIGGCVGYLITALDWHNSVMGDYLGGQERTVFVMLAMLYLVSLLTTFGSVNEAPLVAGDEPASESASIPLLLPTSKDILQSSKTKDSTNSLDPGYVSDDVLSSDDNHYAGEKPKSILPGQENLSGISASFLSFLDLIRHGNIPWTRYFYALLPDNIRSLFKVPMVLRRLALANFCSWTAVMAFNLFYTDFVGQAIYNGDPHAEENSLARHLYDEGVRAGSWGLLLHCVTSSLYAPAIESIASSLGMRNVYMMGMLSFSGCMLAMLATKNIYIVNALAACTGVAYATMTTIPFMLVTSYHSAKELYFYDTIVGVNVPTRGFGTDLSTLDSAYFLSQVVLTSFMGSIVHYTHTVGSYVMCASLAAALACFCIRRVVSDKTQMQTLIKIAVV